MRRMILRHLTGPALLAALAIVFAARSGAAGVSSGEDVGPTSLTVAFGTDEVWSPGQDLIRPLFECQQKLACVSDLMQANGASPGAVAFFHLTGWFLTDIQDLGPVQLGTIFVPWRANENTQLALLGGMPAVVYPEQASGLEGSLNRNADYQALLADHADLMFWTPGPTFEGMDTSPDGGQRFLLKYRLLDGCHACAILGWAHAAFDFGPDGTYEGLSLLSVEPT